MSESSYIKIYRLALQTEEGQRFISSIKRRIDDVSILRYDFRIQNPTGFGQRATYEPRFGIGTPLVIGVNRISDGVVATIGSDRKVWTTVSDYFSTDEATRFIRAIMAEKKVPTFNCSVDVVTGVAKRKKDRRNDTIPFTEFVYNNVEVLRAAHNIMAQRIDAAIEATMKSDKFLSDANKFMLDSAISEIKFVLSKYSHLGDEVLKNAVSEYVVHTVFEV